MKAYRLKKPINRSFDFLERAGPSPTRNGFLTASLWGIATERDLMKRLLPQNLSPKALKTLKDDNIPQNFLKIISCYG